MIARKLRCAALVCLLCSISSLAMAGSFTPEAGTTITSNSVIVGWTSTTSEQWVRAYNSNAEKIFDSGRQMSSSGQVNFAVASSESLLRVIFYEKTGSWVANERTYSVAIGGMTDGDTTSNGITLNDLNCTTGQLAQYDSGTWICATVAVGTQGPQGDPGPQGPVGADGMNAQLQTYSLGATGPAGGFVFYVTDDGLHGYEAAPVDQGTASWCGSVSLLVIGSRAVRLGSGLHNTHHIVAKCEAGTVADLADVYSHQGYDDWFLPSKDALNLMYENLHLLGQGGFSIDGYWSSSESNVSDAWNQAFFDGFQDGGGKNFSFNVRAVRAF